ncbi:MAG: ATP-binding protein [Deltaproteobacteria bacterium]|nr:ATP-binding protein [Deltaproteobacteria bacterium]
MKSPEPAPHILVVGNAPHLSQSCKEACRELGWKHSEQVDASALDAGRFDLIVTDLELPNTDALQLLRDLRCGRPQIPILVVPRCATVERSTELLREGATEVLFPSEDAIALLEALQRDLVHGKAVQGSGLFEHSSASVVTLAFRTAEVVGRKIPLCLAAELEECGKINKKTRHKLELAFQEAVANALEHGNLELDSRWRELIDAAGADKYSAVKKQRLSQAYYADRKLVISFEYCDDVFTIRVRDEGPGFCPPPSDLHEQKTASLKCSGRGLAIISRSVDEVSYVRGGREICMRKRVSCNVSHGRGA